VIYEQLATLIEGLRSVALPSCAQLRRLERAFVDDVVNATNALVS
jgi:hypothetical protein